ncbi:MAG: RidA family protein [Tissierellia bacterium]|nr:RidA family protein [Tissierellia bacterium]
MKAFNTDKAPAAIGPYVQALKAGNFLYISGQTPIVPETGKLVEGDIEEQTRQVFKNIEAILVEAGYEKTDVVKSTVFLTDMANFQAMNKVYAEFYGDHRPTRSAFAVKALPVNAIVEIETICYKE